MLDKLPLELLDEVLDHLSFPADLEGARKRTNTLASCCLVSKRIHSRAKLLIWRNIWVIVRKKLPDFVKTVEAGLSADSHNRVHTLHVWMIASPETKSVWARTLAVVQQFSSTRTLDLYGKGELVVELDVLAASLPLLTTLRLASVVLALIPRHTVFNSFHSLNLHFLSHTSASIRSLPSVDNCPALRALVMNPSGDPNASRDLLSSLDHRLARQLDMVQVQGEYSAVNAILQSPVHILVSVDGADIDPPVAFPSSTRHLRFCQTGSAVTSGDLDHLDQLLGSTSLSFHLPADLHPSAMSSQDVLFKPMTDLVARCDSLNVEVLWYDPSEEKNYDLSPSFWRYAKRLQAEKEAATASRV